MKLTKMIFFAVAVASLLSNNALGMKRTEPREDSQSALNQCEVKIPLPDEVSIIIARETDQFGVMLKEQAENVEIYKKTLCKHKQGVSSVAISHDGLKIASGSTDKKIRIWDSKTGECLQTLDGTEKVFQLTFNSDDTQIIAILLEGIRSWDIKTGRCLKTFANPKFSLRSIFNHDGTKIASLEYPSIGIWDLATEKLVMEFGADVSAPIAFNHDGTKIAYGSRTSTGHIIKIWDVATGQCLVQSGEATFMRALNFNHDGTQVVSANDGKINIWDASTGKLLKECRDKAHVSLGGDSIEFNHDGTQIVEGIRQKIMIWDVKTGKCLKILSGYTGRLRWVGFSHDANQVISGQGKEIWIWDIKSLNEHVNKLRDNCTLPLLMVLKKKGRQ